MPKTVEEILRAVRILSKYSEGVYGTTRIVEGFGKDSEEKYYINISPPDLNALRKTTKRMPPNTSPEKLTENQRLIERLKKFFLRSKISETS